MHGLSGFIKPRDPRDEIRVTVGDCCSHFHAPRRIQEAAHADSSKLPLETPF